MAEFWQSNGNVDLQKELIQILNLRFKTLL